jgi:hypothetical protein
MEFITRSWDEDTADRTILRDSYKANFDRAYVLLKPLVELNKKKNPKTSWAIIECVLDVWGKPLSETNPPGECSEKTSP